MKSLINQILAFVVLLSGSVLVYAQSPAFMPLHEYSTGSSTDEYGSYRSLREHDTVSCMALGCPGSRYGYGEVVDRTRVVELPGRPSAEAELSRRLKDDEVAELPRAEPRAKPKNEQAARDEFYRRLHRHADGRGTLEEVEDAYRDLLPYRR